MSLEPQLPKTSCNLPENFGRASLHQTCARLSDVKGAYLYQNSWLFEAFSYLVLLRVMLTLPFMSP